MTLVSSIILDSLRETNIIAIGTTPTDAQYAEGLRRLQTIIQSVYGNEAGENLQPLPLGRNEINSPSGYPWYNNELPGNMFIPVNVRLMCNLTGDGTVNLHPTPDDGARFGVVDVSQNLSTFPLTIQGNGRSIEGDEALTIDVNGYTGTWFYRGDLGNWVKYDPVALTDTFPFPEEFDDFFIIMLAARINPRYGQTLDPQSVEMLKRARTQFRARYKQEIQVPVEDGLLYMSGDLRYGGRFYSRTFGDSNQFWNAGYPW